MLTKPWWPWYCETLGPRYCCCWSKTGLTLRLCHHWLALFASLLGGDFAEQLALLATLCWPQLQGHRPFWVTNVDDLSECIRCTSSRFGSSESARFSIEIHGLENADDVTIKSGSCRIICLFTPRDVYEARRQKVNLLWLTVFFRLLFG